MRVAPTAVTLKECQPSPKDVTPMSIAITDSKGCKVIGLRVQTSRFIFLAQKANE